MTWDITGRLRGHPNHGIVSVNWSERGIGGDRIGCQIVERIAKQREGQQVGPVSGPYTYTAHLKDPISAAILITGVFEAPYETSGDVPIHDSEGPGIET